jgi:hypothetical protein
MHPAASTILKALNEADMRGSWCREALEMHSRRAVDQAESLDSIPAELALARILTSRCKARFQERQNIHRNTS